MPSSSRALEPVASLCVGMPKRMNASQAEVEGGADFLHQPIDAQLVVAGHGGDLLLDAAARPHEQRQDQVVRRQRGFADEVAQQRMAAQAARADDGETAGGMGFGVHGIARSVYAFNHCSNARSPSWYAVRHAGFGATGSRNLTSTATASAVVNGAAMPF